MALVEMQANKKPRYNDKTPHQNEGSTENLTLYFAFSHRLEKALAPMKRQRILAIHRLAGTLDHRLYWNFVLASPLTPHPLLETLNPLFVACTGP